MEDHPKYQVEQAATAAVDPKQPPTTDELIATAHANRQGEPYPTPERLLKNLPVVLRGLCDYVLSDDADVYHTAYVIASLIDVVENVQGIPSKLDQKLH